MRKSCILMHISSLPSEYGIGKIGKSAFDFVDFLVKSGVKCWQILPISPTSYGDSPYSSYSCYAGNPYFIDFEQLKQEGLLKKSDYLNLNWEDNSKSVNYTKIYNNCFKVLKIAYKNYRKELSSNYHKFVADNKSWINDYALFMALKFKNDGKPWYEWDKKLAMREESAVKKAEKNLAEEVEFFKFIQFKFFNQWQNLKNYANNRGVEIIGDMPIYVAYDSVDVWANPELFCLDKNKQPVDVAGCPPDAFSVTGQLWGNPIYNWENHKKNKFEWWVNRIKFASNIYDTVRIDHFRGFESFYAIPFGNETAEEGEWRKAPGKQLFKTVKEELGDISIIAEDLGFITDDVRELLEYTGFPGMKVLEFGFSDAENEHIIHNFTTSNCIAYTGTHDNDTLKGWVNSMSKDEIKFCKEYLDIQKKKEIPWAVIKATWSSVAETSVAQMQDFLGLDSSARMNTPSTLGSNWQFRTTPEDFSDKLSKKIYKLNKMYNRLLTSENSESMEKIKATEKKLNL